MSDTKFTAGVVVGPASHVANSFNGFVRYMHLNQIYNRVDLIQIWYDDGWVV